MWLVLSGWLLFDKLIFDDTLGTKKDYYFLKGSHNRTPDPRPHYYGGWIRGPWVHHCWVGNDLGVGVVAAAVVDVVVEPVGLVEAIE